MNDSELIVSVAALAIAGLQVWLWRPRTRVRGDHARRVSRSRLMAFPRAD